MLRSDLVGIVRLARPLVPVGASVEGDEDLAFVESLGIRTPVRAGDMAASWPRSWWKTAKRWTTAKRSSH